MEAGTEVVLPGKVGVNVHEDVAEPSATPLFPSFAYSSPYVDSLDDYCSDR